jgi:hypothetical protein
LGVAEGHVILHHFAKDLQEPSKSAQYPTKTHQKMGRSVHLDLLQLDLTKTRPFSPEATLVHVRTVPRSIHCILGPNDWIDCLFWGTCGRTPFAGLVWGKNFARNPFCANILLKKYMGKQMHELACTFVTYIANENHQFL